MVQRFAVVLLGGLMLAPIARAQAPAAPRTDALGDLLPSGAVARLGTLRFKHQPDEDATIDSVTYSPDGKKVASWVQRFGSVRLWDVATGKEIAGPWTSKDKQCTALAFSADGTTLATAGGGVNPANGALRSADIILWDVAGGKSLKHFEGTTEMVRALVFAENGKVLVSAGDGMIRWRDVATGKEERSWKPFSDEQQVGQDNVKKIKTFYNCCFSPDAKFIGVQVGWRYQGGPPRPPSGQPMDQQAVGFDLATSKMNWRTTAQVQDRQVRFAFSGDSKRVAVALGPDKVELRSSNSGKLIGVAPLEARSTQNNFMGGLALSCAGTTIALAGLDSKVTLWTPDEPAPPRKLVGRVAQYWGNSTECLAFSHDDKVLLIGGDADLQFYDVATLQEVVPWDGHRGWVDSVAFSPDGKRLLTGGAEIDMHSQEVVAWEVPTWKRLQTISTRTPLWPNMGVPSPELSVYAGKVGDDRFSLFDLPSGKLLTRLTVPKNQNAQARGFFSPGSKFYVLAAKDAQGKDIERLYAVPSGKLLCELPYLGPLPAMQCARPITFSSDNRLVALVSRANQQVYIIETATGKLLQRLGREMPMDPKMPGGPINIAHLAFSRDNKVLASCHMQERVIRLWDVESGKERLQLRTDEAGDNRQNQQGNLGRAFFTWSPDGRVLAVADRKIRLIELATLGVRRELPGHDGASIRNLAFSPNGRLLASGSGDTTVLVWDVATPDGSVTAQRTSESGAIDVAWQALAGTDAAKAFAAICELVAVPQDAVPLIEQHIKPAPAVDAKRVEELIQQLEDVQYKVRQKAIAELMKLGDQIVPAIDKALAGNPPLETRLRLQDLHNKLTGLVMQDERLRAFRAVEVLERIDAPPARQLLQALAGGATGARLTTQARAALDRLQK